MMFRPYNHIFHTRLSGKLHPLPSIELIKFYLFRFSLIFLQWYFILLHNPLSVRVFAMFPVHRLPLKRRPFLAVIASITLIYRINTPVHKHTEARLMPPTHTVSALGFCFIGYNMHRRSKRRTFIISYRPYPISIMIVRQQVFYAYPTRISRSIIGIIFIYLIRLRTFHRLPLKVKRVFGHYPVSKSIRRNQSFIFCQ